MKHPKRLLLALIVQFASMIGLTAIRIIAALVVFRQSHLSRTDETD
jgi:hypothetical protein